MNQIVPKIDKAGMEPDRSNLKILFDFLDLSARPDTTGPEVESHLLMSLAVALRTKSAAN